jgi:hypothetical protein
MFGNYFNLIFSIRSYFLRIRKKIGIKIANQNLITFVIYLKLLKSYTNIINFYYFKKK